MTAGEIQFTNFFLVFRFIVFDLNISFLYPF